MALCVDHFILLLGKHFFCHFAVRAGACREQVHAVFLDFICCCSGFRLFFSGGLLCQFFCSAVRFHLLLRRFGVNDIINGSVFVLLAFSVVPVLDRTVISRDTAVNLCLFSADRTGKVLAGEIAVVRTDRIGRGQRVVRQLVVLCNLPHEGSCCFPVRQLFAEERMEYRS